jgi:3D-(3,5/4)-trihydroxycyclohexane-1,2-dione acylhydrolase (decyclizing)
MEYGYSCMGYEIAGGMGVKMAAPEREVYVMVGDGSYLMMAQEIVTAVQEGYKLNIILLDNHGFSSIGGLSRSCGNRGMGTEYRYRKEDSYSGGLLPVDFVANAASLGAHAVRAKTGGELRAALVDARKRSGVTVVVVETAIDQRVSGYESWWDVPIAEVSESSAVRDARKEYEKAKQKERIFL